jgi:hypothetical protein
MPEGFEGNFSQHIAEARKRRENQLRLEGETDEVAITERAEEEAQFLEAQRWLVDHWGEEFECPVCSNVQWLVSNIFPAYNGFSSFQVTCRYCGNSMSVIPGHADLPAPIHRTQQLQLPTEEDM